MFAFLKSVLDSARQDSNRGRRGSRNSRFEPLERRELLSVAPARPIMPFEVGPPTLDYPASEPAAELWSAPSMVSEPQIELLAPPVEAAPPVQMIEMPELSDKVFEMPEAIGGYMPWQPSATAAVVTPHVYDQWADSRYPEVTAAEEMVVAFQPGTLLESISYDVIGNDGAFESFTLYADLTDGNGRLGMDGYHETNLCKAKVVNGRVSFDLGWGIAVPQQGLSIKADGTFADDAEAGKHQLEEPSVELSHWGRSVRPMQFGHDNPLMTYEVLADMNISIDGPASQEFQPGDNDVVLANVDIDVSEDVTAYLPFLVEGNTALEDVEVQNRVTGETYDVQIDPWGTFEGSQVYTIEGADLQEGLNQLQIVADVVADAESGTTLSGSMLNRAYVEDQWFSAYAYQTDGGGGVKITPEGVIAGPLHTVEPLHTGALAEIYVSGDQVGDTVAKGATVDQLTVTIEATGDEPVAFESVTLVHSGFGASDDIEGVSLSVDGTRFTHVRYFDSEDQTATLRFNPVWLQPGEEFTFTVDVTYSTGAATGGEHAISIEYPSDVFGNFYQLIGAFPLQGETFRVAAVSSGTVTLDYRVVQPDTVSVGMSQVVIGAFNASVDTVEDQTFYSITVDVNGPEGAVENLALRRNDGTILTNVATALYGEYYHMAFDPPFTLLEGDQIEYQIVADIVGGEGGSISVEIEQDSDVHVVGSLFGYGVNGQTYGSPVEINGLPFVVDIEAPSLGITITDINQDYSPDDNDAVLGTVNLTTDTRAEFEHMYVLVEGQDAVGNPIDVGIENVMEDVEIRNRATGRTIDGVRLPDHSGVGYQIYRFDAFTVQSPGTESWEVRADFIDDQGLETGNRFRIWTSASDDAPIDFGGLVDTTTYYNPVVTTLDGGEINVSPGGVAHGNFHRVEFAHLSIAQINTGSTDTAVSNQDDITLLRFEARAGEVEDILFTKAVFEAEQGDLLNCQNYSFWVDTDGNSVVDTILENGVYPQSNQVTFRDLASGGYVIPEEWTVVFEVHADVSSSLSSDPSLQLGFAVDTSNYIEAEELDDGSNLVGIITDGIGPEDGQIDVRTTDGIVWNFVSQGDLFVTKDTFALRNRQLLGGELGEPVLRLTGFAVNESSEARMDFGIIGDADSIDRLELWRSGDNVAYAIATRAGAQPGFDFGTSSYLVFPEFEGTDILVRPRIKTDVEGGTSGDSFAVSLGAVDARGMVSSNNLLPNDGDSIAEGEIFIGVDYPSANQDIVGRINEILMSKITTITNASNDADNSAIQMLISDIGSWKFGGPDHNNYKNGLDRSVIDCIAFNVNATNVTLSDEISLYNREDSTVMAVGHWYQLNAGTYQPVVGSTATGSLLAVFENLYASDVDTAIDPGDDITLVLQADVLDPNNSTVGAASFLQGSLQSFNDISDEYGMEAGDSRIKWRIVDAAIDQVFSWVEYPMTSVKSTRYTG